MAEKKLMKGNEALAEGAIRAGCRFFAGYPITPQNEIPEYMSWRLPQVGGAFVQAESEVSAINMVYGAAGTGVRCMTSSSSPGISLKQEGISYAAGADLPIFIGNVMRGGPGLGNIAGAQGDYWQATRGGGHGEGPFIDGRPGNGGEQPHQPGAGDGGEIGHAADLAQPAAVPAGLGEAQPHHALHRHEQVAAGAPHQHPDQHSVVARGQEGEARHPHGGEQAGDDGPVPHRQGGQQAGHEDHQEARQFAGKFQEAALAGRQAEGVVEVVIESRRDDPGVDAQEKDAQQEGFKGGIGVPPARAQVVHN